MRRWQIVTIDRVRTERITVRVYAGDADVDERALSAALIVADSREDLGTEQHIVSIRDAAEEAA